MLGANPVASNGSMWALGDARGRLLAVKEARRAPGALYRRRTETAALCSEHHPIRPASDAAVLLAFLHVLFTENLVDLVALDAIADGRDALEYAAARFSPERVAGPNGVPAEGDPEAGP